MKIIKEVLEVITSGLLELIYPEKNICFICDTYDEDIKDKYICYNCNKKLEFLKDNLCVICGKVLDINNDLDKCSQCISNEYYFDRAISPLKYSGIIKKAIYKYKYNNKPYMYKLFGSILLEHYLYNNIYCDIIVPVPLHKKRKIKRGFNQSELIGKYLGRKLGIKVDIRNLVRTKNTSIQNKLNRNQRKENLKNAFKIKNKELFEGKSILLIDDIFTTGSTVNECSKILKKCNPKEIVVLTIATGIKN